MGVFTVIMLFRTDWDVYMRGLEGWDVGNNVHSHTIHFITNNDVFIQLNNLVIMSVIIILLLNYHESVM